MAENPSHYGLSAAARLAGVSESAMRRYSNVGVVNPQRDSAGRRMFSAVDIERARAYRNRSASPERGDG